MQTLKLKTLKADQKEAILKLWNAEYPKSIQHKSLESFENYLQGLSNTTHFLISSESDVPGWLCLFTRNEERCFAMILGRKIQGQGVGKKLLALAKENEEELFGWVVDVNDYQKTDGSLYSSPVGFYLKNGFKLLDERWDNDLLKSRKIVWRHTF